jgi:hypothetical protein
MTTRIAKRSRKRDSVDLVGGRASRLGSRPSHSPLLGPGRLNELAKLFMELLLGATLGFQLGYDGQRRQRDTLLSPNYRSALYRAPRRPASLRGLPLSAPSAQSPSRMRSWRQLRTRPPLTQPAVEHRRLAGHGVSPPTRDRAHGSSGVRTDAAPLARALGVRVE